MEGKWLDQRQWDISEIVATGEIHPVPGESLMTVYADSGRDALAKYALAEGFADPRELGPDDEDGFSEWPRDIWTMVFTNTEMIATPRVPVKTFMTVRFDVTDLTAGQRDALAGEVIAQHEASDRLDYGDGDVFPGHPDVPYEIEWDEIEEEERDWEPARQVRPE